MLAIVAIWFLAGCFPSDGGGHALSALNDTDDDVILTVSTDKTQTFVLPAHGYAGFAGGVRGYPAWLERHRA